MAVPKTYGGSNMAGEITSLKKAQRKYEDIHKDQRKEATGQFNTRLPRPIFDEINGFLKEHRYSQNRADLRRLCRPAQAD